MKNKVFLSFVIFLSFLFVGCGGISSPQVPSSNFKFKKNDNVGLVFFSQVHSKDLGENVFYLKKMDSEDEKKYISEIDYYSDDYDFEEGNYKGNLKIYQLKEGKYQFYRWTSLGYGSTGDGEHKLNFQVKAGEVAYIGSLVTTKTKRKLINPHELSLFDSRERDFKLFLKKMKNIPQKKIIVRFVKPAQE